MATATFRRLQRAHHAPIGVALQRVLAHKRGRSVDVQLAVVRQHLLRRRLAFAWHDGERK